MYYRLMKTIVGICVGLLIGITVTETKAEPAMAAAVETEAESAMMAELEPEMLSEDTGMDVNIRKRAQWTDESDGDALLTLQYSSELGSMQITPDMNVVIIQDKSGSMDSNYGHNLEVMRSGWETVTDPETEYYPILNDLKYSELVSSISSEGYDEYFGRLIYFDDQNGAGCHEVHTGYNNGMIHNAEMFMNSPCQIENHYYFVIKDIDTNENGEIETDEGEIYAWRMVNGVNLYNISDTDLHHYVKLNTREEALIYLEEGRRVVRMTSGYYLNENSQVIIASEESPVYFLDMTEIVNYGDGWILSTCDKVNCQPSDRLHKSQEFLINLVNRFSQMNPENKIAYVPFWGDVPEDGTWENRSGGADGTGLYAVSDVNQITAKEGVSRKDFTSDISQITDQIGDTFTYNGTNWSLAFQCATQMIENQILEDEENGKEKETLIIFLTDGQPQGYAGQYVDIDNILINGDVEIAALHDMETVTVFTCGVCINNSDGDTEARLNAADTTGTASYARITPEFDLLADDLMEKIYNNFLVETYGEYAFYTDVLSENFELDESALDTSWKILATPYSYTAKGVPYNVYSAVVNSSTVTKVYIRSTKTIYWYIGKLEEGGYAEQGHTITVPVTYNYYKNHTCTNEAAINGSDRLVSANTAQKLTYFTNYIEEYLDEEQMATVEIETPQLVFNRSRSRICIRKYISDAEFDTEQTYTFAYSTTQYTGGDVVTDALGTFSITIPAGGYTKEYYLYDLEEGTYYFYEIDENDTVMNPIVNVATVSYTGEISTQAYSEAYPYSITKSDSDPVENEDNVLTVKAPATSYEFFYNYYTGISGTKTWVDQNNEAGMRPSVYTIKLYRNGEYLKEESFASDEPWSFTNLERDDYTGAAYDYTVMEDPVFLEDNYKYVPTIEGTDVTNTLTKTDYSGDITVIKQIPHESISWEHGNPTFTVRIKGEDVDGVEHTFFHMFEFTKEYVEANKNGDHVSMTYTFSDIPFGSRWCIEEVNMSRYDLTGIAFNRMGGGICGVLYPNNNEGFYERYGYVMLTSGLEKWTVTLTNEPTTYQWYSHRAAVRNVIEW